MDYSSELAVLADLQRRLGPRYERDLAPRLRAVAASDTPTDPADRLLAAFAVMDAFVAEEEVGAAQPTACGPGCDFCCHTHEVIVSELEAVLLVRAIAAHPQRKDILARIQRSKSTTNGPKTGSPCALLGKDGLCSIHPSRASTCRVYLSTSRKACKYFAQDRGPRPETVRAFPYLVAKMTADICTRDTESRAGSDGKKYEINALMRRVFADPARVEAWKDGKPTHEADLVVTLR